MAVAVDVTLAVEVTSAVGVAVGVTEPSGFGSLVLGGALGNLVDRIRYGEVIDFIEVHLGSYQHPTFNIADIAIVVGVGLMAIDMFTPRRRPEAEAPAPTKPAKA